MDESWDVVPRSVLRAARLETEEIRRERNASNEVTLYLRNYIVSMREWFTKSGYLAQAREIDHVLDEAENRV